MTKHTILFLAANPIQTDRLELDREAHEIQAELERSRWRDRFELVTRWAAEPIDLLRELRRLTPTVIQFSGHGTRAPDAGQAATLAEPGSTRDVVGADAASCQGLYFQGSDGRPRIVTVAALGEAFGAAGASVRLVVLNACYSEPAAEALLEHVECVVGMAGSIGDDAARSFAIGFYGGLADRESVAAAFRQGCAAISLEGLREADRPRLQVRDGVDAERLVLAAEDSPRDASSLDAAHAAPPPDIGAPAPLARAHERSLAGEVSEPDAALQRDAVLRGARSFSPGGLVMTPVPGPPSSARRLVSGARTFRSKITEREPIDSPSPPPAGIDRRMAARLRDGLRARWPLGLAAAAVAAGLTWWAWPPRRSGTGPPAPQIAPAPRDPLRSGIAAGGGAALRLKIGLRIRTTHLGVPRDDVLHNDDIVMSGDRIRLEIETSEAAHLYLAFCSTAGELTLFPANGQSIAVRANETTIAPAPDRNIVLDDNPGLEVLYVLVSHRGLSSADPQLHAAIAAAQAAQRDAPAADCGQPFGAVKSASTVPVPAHASPLPAMIERGAYVSDDGDTEIAQADGAGIAVLRYRFTHVARPAPDASAR